jgi:hypothetical protein
MPPLFRYLLFPAVTMSLGWGLRGFIGGGPLGAMIPGAMVALALCLALGRRDSDVAIIAAFGAVGIGFGGQETYGQTVGYALQADTMWWGILGLALKGAVWGLLGGAVLGAAFRLDRLASRHILAAVGLMVLGTHLGWKLVNQPKLLYFSNRLDRPREELWAGLMLGGVLLLVYFWRIGVGRAPAWFSVLGFLGGGIGFGLGGLIFSLARQAEITVWSDWWKTMEFTFGFCFGWALGWAAWLMRDALEAPVPMLERPPSGFWLTLAAVGFLAAVTVFTYPLFQVRYSYTLVGAFLLWAASRSRSLSWHIAITLTCCAFFFDWSRYYHREWGRGPEWVGWTLAAVASLAVWFLVWRRYRRSVSMVAWSFLLLTWVAVADALLKFAIHPSPLRGVPVASCFLVLALAATWLLRRYAPEETPV